MYYAIPIQWNRRSGHFRQYTGDQNIQSGRAETAVPAGAAIYGSMAGVVRQR